MTLVVDASVAAKWFADEEHSERALGLLRNKIRLAAPDQFLLEMDSLVCKWIRRKIITVKEGKEIRKTLRMQTIEYRSSLDLLEIAFEIATQTGSSFYDCLYLALAFILDAKLVTADQRLFDSISKSRMADFIVWISDTA